MTSSEYWRRREATQREKNIRDEAEYAKELRRIYEDMMDGVQKEIDAFYARYAAKAGITLAAAKRRADKLDIEAYERKAKKYVREKNFSKQANDEMRLYNLVMKVNRLELLKANIGLELVGGFDEMQKFFDEKLTDRTLSEFRRQAGILGKSVQNNAAMAHAIVNASFHNATFSDRIWMYQDILKSELAKQLQIGLIQGKNPRELARSIRKRFDVSQSDAERLMITELLRVQIEADMQSLIRNGYEEYRFLAQNSACSVCAALHGKHFKVADMKIGVNAPPMHPNCHCSVSAYMDRAKFDKWLDSLGKGGSTADYTKYHAVTRSGKTVRQTGGKRYKPYDEKNKKDAAAAKEYRKISRKNDIDTIAANTGFKCEEIKQIKRHVFFEKHKKYDGYGLLDPDYDIAVAWKRLQSGKYLERDITLLRHELLESQLETMYNLTISEAHDRANQTYSWWKQVVDEIGEGGEKYGIL